MALASGAHVTFRHSGIRVAQLLHHRPLPGLSGMASPAATDLAMFSLVQAIIAADAGLIASTAVIAEAANRIFILFLPRQPNAAQ